MSSHMKKQHGAEVQGGGSWDRSERSMKFTRILQSLAVQDADDDDWGSRV